MSTMMRTVVVGKINDPALENLLEEGVYFVSNDLPLYTPKDNPDSLSEPQPPKVAAYKWALEQADAAIFITPAGDPDRTLRNLVSHAINNGNSLFHLKSLVAIDRETGIGNTLEAANWFLAQSLDLADSMERSSIS